MELEAACLCALVPDYSVGLLDSADIDCRQGKLETENREGFDVPSPDYPQHIADEGKQKPGMAHPPGLAGQEPDRKDIDHHGRPL